MFHQRFASAKDRISVITRLTVVFAMVLALVCLFAISAKAKSIYTIQADSSIFTVESESLESAQLHDREIMTGILNEAGVDVNSTDQIIPIGYVDSGDSSLDPVMEVTVTRAQYATVTIDGSFSSTLLQEGDTVQDLVDRLNIELGEFDIISLNGEDISEDLSVVVEGNDSILINRVEITYFDKVKESGFDSYRVADPDSYIGTEYVKQYGVKGKKTTTYQKKIIDGGEPIITKVGTKYEDAKDQITAYGTRVSFPGPTGLSASKTYITNRDEVNKTITLSDGSTYGYSSIQSFSATAYTSNNGRTSTGRKAQVGVVAVDPSVIPYGTLMYIHSGGINYGVCVAGDCGVHGKLIDLYYNSRSECFSFGRRGITVYFLN